MTRKHFEVIVGNVGSVYSGNDVAKSRREYAIYVDISKTVEGSRAYGESVTRLCDGEIVQEYIGHLQMEDDE